MGKIKDAINNEEDIYMYINSFNDIQKCKRHMLNNCADCDDRRYHEEQDHKDMQRANK